MLKNQKDRVQPAVIEPDAYDMISSDRPGMATEAGNDTQKTAALAIPSRQNPAWQTIDDSNTDWNIEILRLAGHAVVFPLVDVDDCISQESRDRGDINLFSDNETGSLFSSHEFGYASSFVIVPSTPKSCGSLPTGRPLPAPPLLRPIFAESDIQVRESCP